MVFGIPPIVNEYAIILYTKYMKYLVAVSGGIDSVVLLDMLVRVGKYELIVAHFDHGIREDSAADARFVAGLAKQYQLPFTTRREELGKEASEERARERRYVFLRKEARKREAVIVTAHHLDDGVETIAINLTRGTGWRGLAVFGAADIRRPLLHFSKEDIREYANDKRLEWVEDSTNESDVYLRNRLRRRISQLTEEDKTIIIKLWRQQVRLKSEIDREAGSLIDIDRPFSRYFFTMVDQQTGRELLRQAIKAKTGASLTLPQTDQALLAIKTARPDSLFQAGSGVTLQFTATTFIA